MRELIKIESKDQWLKLRTQDVTSTGVSVLFGLNPYQTLFEYWHLMRDGQVAQIEENERMKWGNRLEPAIASGIAEDMGLSVEPFKDYVRLPDQRLGSSFDYKVNPDGILEVKNVDSLQFHRSWESDGDNLESPPHIELQVQHQLLVSGAKFAIIGALVGGNKVVTIRREPDLEIFDRIQERAADFWFSIKKNVPPDPDFRRDAEFIKALHRSAIKGEVIEAIPRVEELARHYKSVTDKIKDLEQDREAVKAELLTLIGPAEKVLGSEFSISAGEVGETAVSYVRKGFRNFRINWKGNKS